MMLTDDYTLLGIMSGTSLDGIDLCYMTLHKTSHWQFKILKAETIAYPKHWVEKLKKAVHFSTKQLEQLNIDYTNYLATVIETFIEKHNIEKLDAVCSHGHTILHEPENNYTLQIGNLPSLAKKIKQTVICDFRIQDVKLGGQGAPLVPIGDKLLFSSYDLCLNLGGFANVSTEMNRARIAYDICPVNTVLNHYAESIGLEFDNGGKIASEATINHDLLQQLNHLEFYTKKAPKSLGIEWVHKVILPLINSFKDSTENNIATFTEHCSQQIGKELERYSKNNKENLVFITGGGAFNTHLINRIKHHSNSQIVIPDYDTINYKEAVVFGLLGILRLRNEINVLSSVTGASTNHCAGYIFQS